MRTVVIVDDDKLARVSLKGMIRESGVSVQVIIECTNGAQALEVAKEQTVDVIFTDICMPVMNGVELVRSLASLPRRPLVVAVSGHDDFTYAVEMMRAGVQDYILKPVEMERLSAVMRKLENQLSSDADSDLSHRQMHYQQLKYLILDEDISQQELQSLITRSSGEFPLDTYRVCMRRHSVFRLFSTEYIYLDNVAGNDLFLIAPEYLQLLLKNELAYDCVGVSREHHGLGEFRTAYREALHARQIAFLTGEAVVEEARIPHIPERLRENAARHLENEAHLQRVQLIGTDKTQEMVRTWKSFFQTAQLTHFTPDQFETALTRAISDIRRLYHNVLREEDHADALLPVWHYLNLQEYRSVFCTFLLSLNERISVQGAGNGNAHRMQEAVDYIEENYDKDINMAMVSNYISMNYSQFSYSFKQYTGSNFVNYLKNIRMEQAKRLLRETDMRINEIQARVGYDNEKHFMKTFKASCGVTPSEYRKNARI